MTMDLKSLRYFLTTVQEGSISAAAEKLHLSQPNLSRQISALERDLGAMLLVRGNRRVELTEEGRVLARRASEILELAEIARGEVGSAGSEVRGVVRIGAGETDAMRLVARAAAGIHADHPGVTFEVHSGNAQDVTGRLDRGLDDFGVVIEPVDKSRYDFIPLPASIRWGLMVRRDDPLVSAGSVRPGDLAGRPLVVSKQMAAMNAISGWAGADPTSLDVVATYNLLHNASLMVSEGLGSALCLEGIVNTTGDSDLAFLPLDPPLEVGMALIWRRHGELGRAQRLFLDAVRGCQRI